jgi:hypothetical protein
VSAVDLIEVGTNAQSNSSSGFNLNLFFISYVGSHDQIVQFSWMLIH